MDIISLFQAVRDSYIVLFLAEVDGQRQAGNSQLLTEAALRDAQGVALREGMLNLPSRIDMLSISGVSGAQTRSVDSVDLLSFSPIVFSWKSSLVVRLGPFQWDGVSIRITGLGGATDWVQLIEWFDAWFREDEDGVGQLIEVVHFLSDPQVERSIVILNLDLGSAPVEAITSLLDVFIELGVGEVTIGDYAIS